jgi:hypothetical protein
MKKDVKKCLREECIRVPLTVSMAKYYLSLGNKCIVKDRGDFYIIKLSDSGYSWNNWSICSITDVRYLIKSLYYLHDTIFLGAWSLATLNVSSDVRLYGKL